MFLKYKERVLKAIDRIKKGEMVILVDDEDRENEGDLYFAAEFSTAEKINFMAKYARGLICLSLSPELTDKLELPMMVNKNNSKFETGFTISIEAREGVTTGISAADRSHTILTAVKDNVKASDLVQPGHIFPLRAKLGGVLTRTGQTEGSVDLSKLAGLKPAGVICEIMNEDGTMARMPELEEFSKKFDIPIVSIEDIISYRLENETIIKKKSEQILKTEHGDFNSIVFESKFDDKEYIVLSLGDLKENKDTLVRVHKECFLRDSLGIFYKSCSYSIREVMSLIQKEKRGVILYIKESNKKQSFSDIFKDRESLEAKEQEIREFGIGAQILRELGLKEINLLTNSNKKIIGLSAYGIKIKQQISIN